MACHEDVDATSTCIADCENASDKAAGEASARPSSRILAKDLKGASRIFDEVAHAAVIAGTFRKSSLVVDVEVNRTSSVKQRDGSYRWVSDNKWFSWGIQLAILFNSLQMGLETCFDGPDVEMAFLVLEHIFTAVFLLEAVVKIYCVRLKYFTDPGERAWNVLDLFVVTISVLDAWIMSPAGVDGGGVSVLKILRLARLARVLKLLRSQRGLMLLIESILGSMKSMGWLAFMLAIIVYAYAIFCVTTIGRSNAYPEGAEEAPALFESLSMAMFTLFSMALGHRAQEILKALYDHQAYLLPVMTAYIMIVMFGVLNAMIGIICQRTAEASDAAEAVEMEVFREHQKGVVRRLKEIMYQMDEDGDGTISQEELEAAARNPEFHGMLRKIDLPASFRLDDVHLMLDKDGDGELQEDEFADGMYDLISSNNFQQQCILMRSMAQAKRQVAGLREEIMKEFQSLRSDLGLRPGDGESGNLQPDEKPRLSIPPTFPEPYWRKESSISDLPELQGTWKLGKQATGTHEAVAKLEAAASIHLPLPPQQMLDARQPQKEVDRVVVAWDVGSQKSLPDLQSCGEVRPSTAYKHGASDEGDWQLPCSAPETVGDGDESRVRFASTPSHMLV